MMAGRKPKPTVVKKLEGNPGKRKLNKNEPVPAKAEWKRLAELMNQMGVLNAMDSRQR